MRLPGRQHVIQQRDQMLVPARSPGRLLQGIKPVLGQRSDFGEVIVHRSRLIIGRGADFLSRPLTPVDAGAFLLHRKSPGLLLRRGTPPVVSCDPMRSPWLDIPLADYEGHMSLPQIGQADLLASEFAALLAQWHPASAAVIGCAGGNGFDRVDVGVTRRVVGIDINPQYVQELAYRYAATLPGLELYVRDIQEPVDRIAPVDLIYAALVLEYVDPEPVLRNLSALCRPQGVLATVLQLPADRAGSISDSPFASLQGLAPALHLVSPGVLTGTAIAAGFAPVASRRIASASGKEFVAQVFQRNASQECR